MTTESEIRVYASRVRILGKQVVAYRAYLPDGRVACDIGWTLTSTAPVVLMQGLQCVLEFAAECDPLAKVAVILRSDYLLTYLNYPRSRRKRRQNGEVVEPRRYEEVEQEFLSKWELVGKGSRAAIDSEKPKLDRLEKEMRAEVCRFKSPFDAVEPWLPKFIIRKDNGYFSKAPD